MEAVVDEVLEKLIEAARTRPVSEAEREAQVRSFAYGNAKIANPDITWEMVDDALAQIKAERTPKGLGHGRS